MIYVIGDSHTRSFAYNFNFFPLFIGAGKENNFVNEQNTSTIRDNIYRVLKNIKKLNYVLFVIGEPDTRFYAGQGWYPWDSELSPDLTGYKEKVELAITRYDSMLTSVRNQIEFKPIIFNVTPSKRTQQNIIVNYFNKCLKALCDKRNILFIDINESIYSGTDDVIREEYFGDTVHLNNKIQPLIEKVLIENNIINKSGFQCDYDWDHKEVMKKFSFDPKFGCYKLSE